MSMAVSDATRRAVMQFAADAEVRIIAAAEGRLPSAEHSRKLGEALVKLLAELDAELDDE
jgi:hypothetical protein